MTHPKKDFFDAEISELHNASRNITNPTPSRKSGLINTSLVNKKRKQTFEKDKIFFNKIFIYFVFKILIIIKNMARTSLTNLPGKNKKKKQNQKKKKKAKANELKEKPTTDHISKGTILIQNMQ